MSRQAAPRQAKPVAIYRRGKVVDGRQASDDSDASDEETAPAPATAPAKFLSVQDKRLEGFTIRDEPTPAPTLDLKLKAPKREESARPVRQSLDPVAATGEESEYETATASEEEEEEESSEEEAPKPIFKPVFVPKRARDTVGKSAEELQAEEDERYEKARQEQAEASALMAAEARKRELAELETEEKFPDVDDTDGLEPEAEFEAWKLRELERLKRDTEALYAREKERQEVEARRAMPEELRLKDDLAYAQSTRDNKPRTQQAFMQKYHHKGVFYTEDDLANRDTSAPTESTFMDVASLPQAMQVRQGKFGKRGQTKYTHLVDQDTSSKDAGWARGAGGGTGRYGSNASAGPSSAGCFHCGGPHLKRDCPDLLNGGPSGANGSGERDRGYGDRVRDDPRRRSRSRSRSPDRDKRRRLDY